MSEDIVLPSPERLSRVLSDLLAKQVRAKASASTGGASAAVIAVYANDNGADVAACACDAILAACLSSAFMMIPAATALEAAAKGDLTESMRDSLHELLNIGAQLLRTDDGKHRIVMKNIFWRLEDLPENIAEALNRPASRLDAQVTIADYSTGSMSFAVL